MGNILLKNILFSGKECDILIKGNRISRISEDMTDLPASTEVVDCTRKVALPGFVNMHTHAGMSMMRGVGEDIAFHEWLAKIWEIEKDIDGDYIYQATRMACLEMIRTGTTTFNDQYWFAPMAYKAASEMGVRSVLSYVVCDRNDPAQSEVQKEECRQMYELSKTWSDLATFVISIHAVYSVSEPMVLWAKDFARENGLKIHIHLSETEKEVKDCMEQHGGMSPVEYFDSLGLLGPDVIAAHTVWLSDNDIDILGKRGVTCVHNINSNLKLASGYRFRYNELRDAGANLCIGTDGCCSSNNLDMLEAMKTSAVVQKAWRSDPASMPLDELLAMSTVNAAKVLGLEIGEIREGALADIMIVDTDNYHFMSPAPFEANFIYSAHSDCISSVICNGKFLMRDRVVPGEREILDDARKYLNKIL
ncbi:MAG: amidohydrolase [Bacteroidales bacterium]|nr:amidohydrolase [Bacteroidales bacterium]